MSQRISLAQNDFTERQIELKSINSMRAEVAFFCFVFFYLRWSQMYSTCLETVLGT